MLNKPRSNFNLDNKAFNPKLLNQIAKVLQQYNINDLIELKNFADSMFNYLKENKLLDNYLSLKNKK